jgi:hypothetical protein
LKRVYRKPDPVAKPDRDFAGELDELCRAKVAELVQSYLEAEVDELLGRLRYERRDGKGLGFRDGHDPERTVTASIGPIAIRRPRVRGVAHESALVPSTVDGSRRSIRRSTSCGSKALRIATSSRLCAGCSAQKRPLGFDDRSRERGVRRGIRDVEATVSRRRSLRLPVG